MMTVATLLCCLMMTGGESSVLPASRQSIETDTLTIMQSGGCDTIQASYVTASSQAVPVPRQTLAGDHIQELSTSSVSDALKYFAGVQIRDYGGLGGMKTVNVRSLGTQHTGVFIDGIRITNCQNGTVDLGKYSLVNMESVELYNSNKSAPLMSASEYASASTLYFKTKRPERTSLTSTYSYGSFNTHKAQLHGSYRDKWFADVESDHSDGNYPFSYHSQYEDTVGIRKNSDITFFRAEGGYFSDHFTTHFYAFSSERGLPGGIVKRLSDKFGDIGREADLNTFAQASYQNSWNNHSLKINGRYAYDYLHANTDFPENQFVRYNNHYTQQESYLSGAYSIYNDWLTFSASPDIRISTLHCDVYGMSDILRCDWKTVADLKIRSRVLNIDASMLFTHVKDHSKMNTADKLTRLTSSVIISRQMSEAMTARAFYKEIFRTPTLNDLYYTHVGRRDLKPEQTRQYDIGISYTAGNYDIQYDMYHNEVTDKIICVPNGGSYDWKMLNRGLVITNGADLSARYSGRFCSAFATVTWQDARDRSDPDDEDSWNHTLLYSPNWSFSAVLSFHHREFTTSVSHLYSSRRYWSYACEDDSLPQYNCTDLKIQYKRQKFTLSAECNNIFDIRHELVQRWPLPGRRFSLSITYTL